MENDHEIGKIRQGKHIVNNIRRHTDDSGVKEWLYLERQKKITWGKIPKRKGITTQRMKHEELRYDCIWNNSLLDLHVYNFRHVCYFGVFRVTMCFRL